MTTTRIIETLKDRDLLVLYLGQQTLPITVTIRPGKLRSIEQNRLQWLWHTEAAEQLKDESAEDKRAYCKLHFGVPILRAGSEEYREQYDRIVKPLPYEAKLALMRTPLDYPVTRLMTTRQMVEYHELIHNHYLSQGVQLTEPGE